MPVSFNPLARSASGKEAPISNRVFGNGTKAQFSTQTRYPANHRFATFTGNAANNTNAPKSNLWSSRQNQIEAQYDPENKGPYKSAALASFERKMVLAKLKANEAAGTTNAGIAGKTNSTKGGRKTRRKTKCKAKNTRGKKH